MGQLADTSGVIRLPWDIAGKSCLVTGATNGIGREIALALARAGAKVVVGGRNASRIAAVQQQIADETGQRPAAFCCDLKSLSALRRAAQGYLDSGQALHVLVHNAGALFATRQRSAEGHEASIAVNHLAPFLLTGLLWPRLQASAPARIIVISSLAHRLAPSLDFNDLMRDRSPYFSIGNYCRAKLCGLLFMHALARRAKGSSITVNAMSPGVVNSGIIGHSLPARMAMWLISPLTNSPAQGADTAVWLCTEAALSSANGGYYRNRAVCRTKAYARSDKAAERLWQLSESLVQLRWGS